MDINEYKSCLDENFNKIVNSLPKNLIDKENNLFNRLSKAPLSNLKKLEIIYELMDELSNHYQKFTACKKGCAMCCSLEKINIHDIEIELIKKKFKIKGNILKPRTDGKCNFLQNNQCSIYEARPYVCRRYQSLYKNNSACLPENQKIIIGSGAQEKFVEFTEIKKAFEMLIIVSNSKRHSL